jgi:hypothetical protein
VDVLDWIGWVATAVFAGSYLCKEPAQLRRVQAVAAVLWLGYGIVIHAMPVIVANAVVALVALGSSWPRRAQKAVIVSESEGSLRLDSDPPLRSG